MNCPAGQEYQQFLTERFEQEAQTLAQLTGWKIEDIRKKTNLAQSQSIPWWRNVWH
jgi:hypothetical protein